MTPGVHASLTDRFLSARVRAGRMPGAAWWIEDSSGPAERGACGFAVLEPEPERLGGETPFDLASLTKPLCTGLLLALLGQEGRLDPDAPVAELLPELGGSAYGTASLVRLAMHGAGLPAWRPLYLQASDRDGYLVRIAAEEPACRPGETLYSDLGYILLGIALERAAGERLDRLFAERVAAPLGLARTGFASGGATFPDAAATERDNGFERSLAGEAGEGYTWPDAIPRGVVHDRNARTLGGVAGHAGLFGPVEEVAAIAREMLRPDRLRLELPARDRLLGSELAVGGRTCGFVLADHALAARGILPGAAPGHTGFTGTSLWLDPAAGRFFILLANRVHPTVPARGFDVVRRGFHRTACGRRREPHRPTTMVR